MGKPNKKHNEKNGKLRNKLRRIIIIQCMQYQVQKINNLHGIQSHIIQARKKQHISSQRHYFCGVHFFLAMATAKKWLR